MKFYAIVRESSDPQERKKGLARQRRQISRFCEMWPAGPHQVYDHHAPVIESASQGDRRDWQLAIDQGIDLARQGTIDAFLFPEVDRETRNPLISIPILRRVLDASIPVYFAEERLHLAPKDPEAITRYTDAVAKSCAYVSTMIQKTRAGRFDRANEDGLLPSNTRMFGFDVVNGRRVKNQAQASAIREAAQIGLREGRPGPAARWLNEQGWRTTHNKPFTPTTLAGKKGLFRNRALIGETTICFREKTVVIHHERILDVATFEQLQAMLDGRRLRQSRSEVFYVLSGIVFCSCGERFGGDKIRSHRYYRCSRRPTCGAKMRHKDELEYEVYEAFGHYLQDLENQRSYLELVQESRTELEKDLSEIERQIEENNAEWRILLAKELADYPDLIINEKKRELTATRQSLLQAKAKTEGDLAVLPEIDPIEVESALSALAKPWALSSGDGRITPGTRHIMSWERASVIEGTFGPTTPHRITEEQGRLLRETLFRLNCWITVTNHAVVISGKLPLGSRAKQGASVAASAHLLNRRVLLHEPQSCPATYVGSLHALCRSPGSSGEADLPFQHIPLLSARHDAD